MFTKIRVFFLVLMIVSLNAFAQLSDEIQKFYPLINSERISLNANNNEYLSLSMNQRYIGYVKDLVEEDLKLKLKDRGEAHITIFNPMEWKVINKYLTTQQMSQRVRQLENIHWEVRCLGRGVVGAKSTYFLVVNSKELLNLREDIVSSVEQQNKVHLNFYPFRPHITVGFTDTDLYIEDGVDKTVCWK